MTVEQVIEKLKYIIASYLMSGKADNDTCGEWKEVLTIAIQALQTQADGDLINRTSVLDVLKIYKVNLTVIDIIRSLPITNVAIPSSVKEYREQMRDATPEERESIDKYIKSISKPTRVNFWNLDDNDDCISRKAVLSLLADHFDNVFDMVKELPSVVIPPEHDGCKDCRYESQYENEIPCMQCKQNYTDKWQKKPHWIHRNDDYTDWLECPSCGYGSEGEVKYGEGTPFCPHCGERLEEE